MARQVERRWREVSTTLSMSAFGPKQTLLLAPHMSAFGVKADNATERIAAMLEMRVKFSDDVAKLALTGLAQQQPAE